MKKGRLYQSGYFNDIISSTILFICAYLFVLYISLFSTAFISFTNHLSIPVEIDRINFDRTTSSNDSIWESEENIFTIFSFSPLVIFILGLLAVIATKKTQNSTLGAFFFWIVFHSIIRLFGDFLFGHIFHLWGPNLVTDFMRITYPNFYLKAIIVTLSLISILSFPLLLANLIGPFFNPIIHRTKEGVKYNFIYPSIIGAAFLFLWISPSFYINEVSILIISIISILILSNFIVKRYKFISFSTEHQENDGFNIMLGLIPTIIIAIILAIVKIILTNGLVLRSSGYRREQLDAIFYLSLIGVLVLGLLFFIFYLIYSAKKKKKKFNRELTETLENIEQEQMDISLLEGTKWGNVANNIKKAQSFDISNKEE